MKIHKNTLRSKVARRIFLLFLVCSMFPVVVLTAITSRMMTTNLEQQAQQQLGRTTKSIGMALLGRLSQVEMELRTMALLDPVNQLSSGTAAWSRMNERLGDHLRSVALLTEKGVQPILGDAPSFPAWLEDTGKSLTPDRVALALPPAGGRSERSPWVFLALDTGGKESQAALVAELLPDYLWNSAEGLDLPSDTELFVLDSMGGLLFTTVTGENAPAETLLAERADLHGGFRWSTPRGRLRGHGWPVFLAPRYGCANWTILVTQPAGGVLTALSWASRILPLTILLCVLVVALLSLLQVRKSLIPVVKLGEGTRRIAAGQFDTRVTVETNDEFAELADSFNGMADRLGAQFHALTTLAEIDRQLLSKLDEEHIVDTLLVHAPDRLRCDRAAMVLDRPHGAESATIHIRNRSDAERRSVHFPRRLARELADAGPEVDPSRLPSVVAAALGPGLTQCHLVPLERDALSGCLILCSSCNLTWTKEESIEAQRLVNQAGVALSNARLVQQLESLNRETLHALARAVDANSPWTAGHSERVTLLSLELARRLGVDGEELMVLHRGGLLHDVGKIGVPGHILDKPGRLTDRELELMRDHVLIGARILEPISGYRREIPIVRHHHERYDGQGYPDGLAGEAIPYLARVLAVADVFDALISDRPYRQGWELGRVVEYVRDAAGTSFDPTVVAAFLTLADQGMLEPNSRGEEPWLNQSDTVTEPSVVARS